MGLLSGFNRARNAVIGFFLPKFGKRFGLSMSGSKGNCAISKRFNTAFAMLPQLRKEALIDHYQRKHRCSRAAAMERAIEDRARDNGLRI
jgi:hypothetical protein